MRSFYVPFTLLLASCAPVAGGRTLVVADPKTAEVDDPASFDGAAAFTTIQDGIDAASSGDTVEVKAGTYTEDLTMKSGVNVVGAGQGQTYLYGTVAVAISGSSSLKSLSAFDPDYIATGAKYGNNGIAVTAGTLVLEDVGLHYFLHAVSAQNADAITVTDSLLSYNWYGIVAEDTGYVTVTNNLIGSNAAGGVAISAGGGEMIVHNTFVYNAYSATSAYLVGAIALANTDAANTNVIANNIVVANYYGIDCAACAYDSRNNDVWGNTTNFVNDASASSSDISADPVFVSSSEGNYALSATSPCIDAGSSAWVASNDADGESRPQGAGYDIGMDEYAVSVYDLVITEVMANAKTESTQEFVEIYNAGTTAVDLAGLKLTDGDENDTIGAYKGGSTTLAAGAYAVVVDPEYTSGYTIDASVTLVTTGDTELGNGLTTGDKVTLYESDGSTVAASFGFPKDPGDGISLEMYDLTTGDVSGNWRASTCSGGSSPGAAHCFAASGDPADLVITEVMANPLDEATGEYVEIYNSGTNEIDAAGLMLADTAQTDTLMGFQAGSTLIGPGEHAVIVDPGYTYDYYLPADIVLLTTGDATIGNGLTTTDRVRLLKSDGTTEIDTYNNPKDPGNGYSMERIDYAAADSAGNWGKATDYCTRGRSPGRLNGSVDGICDPILVNEVMSNPADEDTGEFVELYNAGSDTIDLAGLYFTDGDEVDVIAAYEGGVTTLAPGAFALIVDSEYADEYTIPVGTTIVTLGNSTLGNALAVSDEIGLYEIDGTSVIDAFVYPFNAGNGVSIERESLSGGLDSADNWTAATCASGSSPGEENCVATGSTGGSEFAYDLVITEVMSNPLDESTGEFVEIYNNDIVAVDMLYMVLWDGDALDTIFGWSDIYDTVLEPGQYAVILDADYAGEYAIPTDALVLTVDDSTVGSGLATNDPVYLYGSDGTALADGFSFPTDAGNGKSVSKVSIAAGDTSSNWAKTTCTGGSSPGQGTCP